MVLVRVFVTIEFVSFRHRVLVFIFHNRLFDQLRQTAHLFLGYAIEHHLEHRYELTHEEHSSTSTFLRASTSPLMSSLRIMRVWYVVFGD